MGVMNALAPLTSPTKTVWSFQAHQKHPLPLSNNYPIAKETFRHPKLPVTVVTPIMQPFRPKYWNWKAHASFTLSGASLRKRQIHRYLDSALSYQRGLKTIRIRMHGEMTTVVVGKHCAVNKNVLPQKEGPVAFDSLYLDLINCLDAADSNYDTVATPSLDTQYPLLNLSLRRTNISSSTAFCPHRRTTEPAPHLHALMPKLHQSFV